MQNSEMQDIYKKHIHIGARWPQIRIPLVFGILHEVSQQNISLSNFVSFVPGSEEKDYAISIMSDMHEIYGVELPPHIDIRSALEVEWRKNVNAGLYTLLRFFDPSFTDDYDKSIDYAEADKLDFLEKQIVHRSGELKRALNTVNNVMTDSDVLAMAKVRAAMFASDNLRPLRLGDIGDQKISKVRRDFSLVSNPRENPAHFIAETEMRLSGLIERALDEQGFKDSKWSNWGFLSSIHALCPVNTEKAAFSDKSGSKLSVCIKDDLLVSATIKPDLELAQHTQH